MKVRILVVALAALFCGTATTVKAQSAKDIGVIGLNPV